MRILTFIYIDIYNNKIPTQISNNLHAKLYDYKNSDEIRYHTPNWETIVLKKGK